MTIPASAVIATMSSSVRPVSSMLATTRGRLGRCSRCSRPTPNVTATAAMPAGPASQLPIMSV